jgi:hypothetical protein
MIELGTMNYELGIPIHPPGGLVVPASGGWAAFQIPHSYFLMNASTSRTRLAI